MSRGNYKLHIMQVVSAVMILSAMLPLCLLSVSAEEKSGKCGADISWSLNAGTLTVSGKGDMTDYRDRQLPPWYEFREEIIKLVISDGITSVGNFAFYSCSELKEVTMPNSVKEVGASAFAECGKLESVDFGNLLEKIGASAFYNCRSLRSVRFPYNLTSIGNQAFYRCESLPIIEITRNVTELGNSVFAYCKNLVRAEIKAPLTKLPEWTFYGCELLTVVYLNSTVEDIENYAFRDCGSLSSVYYPATEEKAEKLQNAIIIDVPEFEAKGFMGSGAADEQTKVSYITSNDDKTVVQTNITVLQKEEMTLEYTVTTEYPTEEMTNGKNSFDIIVTVESEKGWETAVEEVEKTVSKMNTVYANTDGNNKIHIDVYMKNDTQLSEKLLDSLAGKDAKLEVMSSGGSVWRVDCKNVEIKKSDSFIAAAPKYDFSHTVKEAEDKVCDKLGTDSCFQITFKEDVVSKAEVLIQLPNGEKNYGNAFLYQKEDDGELTRLQAVKVDDRATAHFFLASVKKDTEYFLGMNVPGEKTDDVIIPDELLPGYGNALERLEIIEYVSTGEKKIGNWGLPQVMVAVLVVIAIAIVVIGVIMFFINKKKMSKEKLHMAE